METINDRSSDNVIERIVAFEWDMFEAVNEGGPRASCQEDRATFEGMRRAQFQAWSTNVSLSYFDDLANAILDGRNLVAEKYIHMMRYASPTQYAQLIQTIPLPHETHVALAQEISDKMLLQTVELFKSYPYVSGSGRPLYSEQDFSGVTSIETYQLGELLTYSEKTLQSLLEHLVTLEKAGLSLAMHILENTVRHYGYATLESAETATRERIERQGIEISFGCDSNSDTGCTAAL